MPTRDDAWALLCEYTQNERFAETCAGSRGMRARLCAQGRRR